MSIAVPPPAETYQQGLVQDAVKRYGVPADEVVLKGVSVTLYTEIVGTVRGWAAEATAGRKAEAPAHPKDQAAQKAGSIEERLRNLKALHDQGLIGDKEFHERQATILNEL